MVNDRLKQPDWLSLYPRDTDASLLTDIVLSHARDQLAELSVTDAATVSAPTELVQFDDVEDVVLNGAPPIPRRDHGPSSTEDGAQQQQDTRLSAPAHHSSNNNRRSNNNRNYWY